MSQPEIPVWAEGWTPVTETRVTEIAAHPCAGLAALLDVDDKTAEVGQPLPPLWHWVALSQWPLAATIGPDGHPKTGGLLPRTPYPRRMWMGSRVTVHEAPTIGGEVRVDRRVEALTEKSGRQGPFALVTVRTLVSSTDGAPLLTEDNQLAYRAASEAGTAGVDADRSAEPAATERLDTLSRRAEWDWQFTPNPVMLMMFSAVSGNAHRIHYDVPYAKGVEGYPNLVVHGPLMAIVLAEVARRERPAEQVAEISVRAQRPMYLGTPGVVRRLPSDQDLGASVASLELTPDTGDAAADSAATMTASVTYR